MSMNATELLESTKRDVKAGKLLVSSATLHFLIGVIKGITKPVIPIWNPILIRVKANGL